MAHRRDRNDTSWQSSWVELSDMSRNFAFEVKSDMVCSIAMQPLNEKANSFNGINIDALW